jgi:ribonucleoside-triphosphate reductase
MLLFATTTCPNCKMAEKFLGDAGVVYEKIYADQQPELAKQYGIVSAPTLIVIDGDKIEKIQNVSNIRKFADSYGK